MKRNSIIFLLLIGFLTSGAFGQTISPILFGQNIWLDKLSINGTYTTVGAMDNLWDDLDAGGTQLVRAGGIHYDENIPPYSVYLEWVNKIQAIGAEPMLQISRKSTAQQAKDLITYINITQKKKVKYWIIGNEPDWHWNMSTPSTDPYYVANAGTVRDYIKNISSAIKSVDPSIMVVGPEVAWMNTDYLTPLLGGWADIAGKDANGNYYVDVVTYHQYNDPTGPAVEGKMNTFLGLLNQVNANRPAANKLKWAITEFNITTDNDKENNTNKVWSFYAGQYFAEVYGLAMKYSAMAIVPWSVQESNGARVQYDLGMFDTAPGLQPRSNYHHYSLLANNFGGTYANGTTTVANVKTFGCVKSNEIVAIVLNESGASSTYSLGLSTQVPVGTTAAKLTIDAGVRTAYQDQIAANETHLLVFDLNGNIKKKCVYNDGNSNNKTAPSCQTFTVSQKPYNGTVQTIPGTIEAENYDSGGNQLSFNDVTSGNQGGAYRTDDVDLEVCTLGGYNVGWIDAGEWLEYTVNVTSTGYYDFKVNVATTTANNTFKIEFDGQDVTGLLTAPNTGAWQTFQAVSKNGVQLSAGQKVMRITFQTGGMNVNNIVITKSTADCNGTPNGTASIDNCGVCSGGTTGKTPNSTCTKDCNGVWGGTAYKDQCDICVGGNTGKTESPDTDKDGVADCKDLCPNDAKKTAPGLCGCGNVDLDVDKDNICDANDNDLDNDGVITANDCDDRNPAIGAATKWYQDLDGDGLGNVNVSKTSCTQPTGYVLNKNDSNDNDFDNDGVITANDCDDKNATIGVAKTWYQDLDGDGLGNAAVSKVSCTQPSGYVSNKNDSNDNDFDNDGISTANDCDDKNAAIGVAKTWYQDLDGDGLGNSTVSNTSCTQPTGYVSNKTDNNDNDFDNDGVITSNDCDDKNASIGVAKTWYQDLDGDGLGNATASKVSCTQPTGYVSNKNDNNDNDFDNDGISTVNDCNDKNSTVGAAATWYQDLDGDGLGNGAVSMVSCTQPTGYVSISGDNNDNDFDNDGISTSNDCDDKNSSIGAATTWFEDVDGDGLGNSYKPKIACTQPFGYVGNGEDLCVYDNTNTCNDPRDCNGEINGTASIDDCGVCSGGKTGVVRNACLTSTKTSEENVSLFKVYPNPFESTFTIQTSESLQLKLTDITGKEIQKIFIEDRITIGENIPSGVYLLVYTTSEKQITLKLIKY